MNKSIKIERMKVGDIEAVYALHLSNEDDTDCEVIDWLNETVVDPFGYLFVAFWCGELAGYCGMYHNNPVSNPDIITSDYCKIGNIVVKKEFRQKGIGKAMMLEMLDKAKDLGVGGTKLEVDTKNNNAVKLYESLGFKIEKTEKGFYDDGDDAYIMWHYSSLSE